MSEGTIAAPAYMGSEPYIFISYAHKNSAQVLPIVTELIRQGYRVWYDEGILPGQAWDNSIADRLRSSHCFLAFLSQAYLASTNCRDELSIARTERKRMSLLYLEDLELTPGMQMRYNRLQALFIHRMDREDVFRKLSAMDGMEETRGGTQHG